MDKLNLPKKHFELIDKAIQQVFSQCEWTLKDSLTRGLSASALYHFQIGTEEYVVRLDDPEHPHNNLAREYQAMQIASDEQIAPQLYYTDPKQGIAIMKFIKTTPIHLPEFANTITSKKLAELIYKLHHAKPFQKDISIFERIDVVYKKMQTELKLAEIVIRCMEEKEKLKRWLLDANDTKSCHCDINPYNLLFDSKHFWLVDWNAASPQNFYFDLACIGIFFYFYSDKALDQFLVDYFRREPTVIEASKFYLMSIVACIYYGIMFLYLSGQQNPAILPQTEIDLLPDYALFMKRIGQGEERLDKTNTQQKFGFVFLKMALAKLADGKFSIATQIVNNSLTH